MNHLRTIALALLIGISTLGAVTIKTEKTLYHKDETLLVTVKNMRKPQRCPDNPAQRTEHNDCNWVGIFSAYDDDAKENLLAYAYAPGNVTDYTFTVAGMENTGEYEARIFYHNNFKEKAYYPFVVKEGASDPDIKTIKSQYYDDEPIDVSIKNFPGNPNDWLGIFSAYDDSVPEALIEKVETDGLKNGKVTLPAISASGDYEVRAFFHGKFDERDYYPFTIKERPHAVTACNFLQNPGFEHDRKHWNLYGKHTRVNNGYKSTKALSLKNGGLDQMTQELPQSRDTYQFHGYYKTTGQTDGIWAGLVFYDGDYHILLSKDTYLRDSGTYRSFTINATAPEGTVYAEVWLWSSAEDQSGSMVVDDLKLSASACYDYPIASSLPPAGLPAKQVPQFVVLGFDDNTKAEGIDWVLDLMKERHNQDGFKAKVSFYLNTSGLSKYNEEDPAKLLAAMQRLRDSGNEMGNHTDDHMQHLNSSGSEDAFFARIRNDSYKDWNRHIAHATEDLMEKVGVVSGTVVGFRTPYLLYTRHSLHVLKDQGFLYDCSIEDGYSPEFDGTNFRWPYRLDGGSPGHTESWYGRDDNPEHVEITPVRGLWELPNAPVMIPHDSECRKYGIKPGLWKRLKSHLSYLEDHKITGLDYNIWSMGKVNKAEFVGILKYNLDLRLKGNHAPFMFGTHSQYYTKEWAKKNVPHATVKEMREAIREFVTYALSKKAVRMTTGEEVIRWCQSPIPK